MEKARTETERIEKRFGITITECPVAEGVHPQLPDGTSGITMDQAITSALPYSCASDASGNLLPDVQVNAVYGLFTDSQTRPFGSDPSKAFYQKVPAWLVTFMGDGVRVISSGPRRNPTCVKHAQVIIIDAKTGAFIESIA